MASIRPFLNNLVQGLTNPKGVMGDFQHAARLYNTNNYRLAPKNKFLFYVVFNLDPAVFKNNEVFRNQNINEVNLLVKTAQLPKFSVSTQKVKEYNKQKIIQTKIEYDDISIDFHDDNTGVVTAFWQMYYEYYFADHQHNKTDRTGQTNASASPAFLRNSQFIKDKMYRYGLDRLPEKPFFTSIQIYQMSKKKFQCFTLAAPIIKTWQHDAMDYASNEPVKSTMTVQYEAVFYSKGDVKEGNPRGFATVGYDKTPSPLSLAGGGTASLFGQGGVIAGASELFGDITAIKAGSGNPFGAAIKGANLYKNIKGLSKAGIKQEGLNFLVGQAGGLIGGGLGALGSFVFPKTQAPGAYYQGTASPELPDAREAKQRGAGGPGAVNKGGVSDYFDANDAALDDLTENTTFRADTLGTDDEWGDLSRAEQDDYNEETLQLLNEDGDVSDYAEASLVNAEPFDEFAGVDDAVFKNSGYMQDDVTGLDEAILANTGYVEDDAFAQANAQWGTDNNLQDEAYDLDELERHDMYDDESLDPLDADYGDTFNEDEISDLDEDGFATDFDETPADEFSSDLEDDQEILAEKTEEYEQAKAEADELSALLASDDPADKEKAALAIIEKGDSFVELADGMAEFTAGLATAIENAKADPEIWNQFTDAERAQLDKDLEDYKQQSIDLQAQAAKLRKDLADAKIKAKDIGKG